ncbi:MAG TPA: response regulator, partial [Aeromicrobium sp.]|nr:response regulator [Aeromicrobium sp.]
DDRDICDMVQHRLTNMGMDVEAFPNGEYGLAAILDKPPDLAIVDMMMPWKNGLDVTRGIRANAATKELPVIVFTALDLPEWREAAQEAGAEHYVIKPFSVAALGAYVEKLLGLRTCMACGRKRDVDEPDYAPEQELHHTAVGWTLTFEGEICGDCRPAVMR